MSLISEARYNQGVRDPSRFLMHSAWALTGSRAIAQVVLQDCFAIARRDKDQLRDVNLARPWLFTIMRRSIFRHITPSTQSLGDADEAQWGQAPGGGIDNRLDEVKAVGRIAPIHREVLALHCCDDMPTARMPRRWKLRSAPSCRAWHVCAAMKSVMTTSLPPHKPSVPTAHNVTMIRKY